MPNVGSGGAGLQAEGAALARQQAARQQAEDDEAHALSGELKEAAGGLDVFGLVCLAVGLVFPPAAVVGGIALEVSEGLLVAGVAVAVAIDHPTQDNWVTVGGDALAVATGYVVGKVIIGPALGALARKLAPAVEEEVAAETAALAEPAPPVKAQSYEELGQKPPCFLAGTRVKTPTGQRLIEELTPGELVLAYDFATGQVVARRVVGVMRNWTRFVVALTLGGEVVRTTREHRFWAPAAHAWLPAAELVVGTAVLTVDGHPARVEQHQVYEAEADTYNFEVAELHNYFVGQAGTLVHNAKQPPKPFVPSVKFSSTVKTPKYSLANNLCYFHYLRAMARVNTPVLDEAAKIALEEGARTGMTPCFRTRCEVILLKALGLTSEEVGKFTTMSYVSVNAWVKRYKAAGLAGLQTKPGRGRKAVLNVELDKESVLQAVQANRQRIQTAKAEWEQETNKSVSLSTFKSFLKVLTAATSVSERDAKGSLTRRYVR